MTKRPALAQHTLFKINHIFPPGVRKRKEEEEEPADFEIAHNKLCPLAFFPVPLSDKTNSGTHPIQYPFAVLGGRRKVWLCFIDFPLSEMSL